MIISPFNGNKVTANQLAKQHIISAIEGRECGLLDDTGDMTEKEQDALALAMSKQVNRIVKLMGDTRAFGDK